MDFQKGIITLILLVKKYGISSLLQTINTLVMSERTACFVSFRFCLMSQKTIVQSCRDGATAS